MKKLLATWILVLAVPFARAQTVPTYALSVSMDADRSGAVALNGSKLSGSVYIFTSLASNPQAYSLTGIANVEYWLDNTAMSGTPTHVQSTVPYDFHGGTATTASPWATTGVVSGEHAITQKVIKSSGATEVDTATFTVYNDPVLMIVAVWNNGTALAGTVSLTQPVLGAPDIPIATAKLSSSGKATIGVNLSPNTMYNVPITLTNGTKLGPYSFTTVGVNVKNLREASASIVFRAADHSIASQTVALTMNY